MKDLLFTSAIILIIMACQPDTKDALQFNKSFTLTGDEILKDKIDIENLIFASDYILAKVINEDYYFKILDKTTLKEIGKIVKKGNGPNEFPTSAIFNHYTRCGTDICAWFHDLNMGELKRVNITKSVEQGKTVIEEEIVTNLESPFYSAFIVNDKRIVGRTGNMTPKMKRLQIYDPTSQKLINEVGLIPEVEVKNKSTDYKIQKVNFLYVSHLGKKGDDSKIVSAMAGFNRLDIYNINGGLEKTIEEYDEGHNEGLRQFLNSEIGNFEGIKFYYMGVFTSDDFIYALFYNNYVRDHFKGKTVPVQLRIFDWNGNPLAKVEIQDYLMHFTIDEEQGIMYGVDIVNEKIVEYNIQFILDEI